MGLGGGQASNLRKNTVVHHCVMDDSLKIDSNVVYSVREIKHKSQVNEQINRISNERHLIGSHGVLYPERFNDLRQPRCSHQSHVNVCGSIM